MRVMVSVQEGCGMGWKVKLVRVELAQPAKTRGFKQA